MKAKLKQEDQEDRQENLTAKSRLKKKRMTQRQMERGRSQQKRQRKMKRGNEAEAEENKRQRSIEGQCASQLFTGAPNEHPHLG